MKHHFQEQIQQNNPSSQGFFQKVYNIVARIPQGKVVSYGQIACLLGRPQGGARLVGWAMKSAPAELNLPCHRVVNQTGVLANPKVFGGEDIQRAMLESEGVTFRIDGRINMEKHLWNIEI